MSLEIEKLRNAQEADDLLLCCWSKLLCSSDRAGSAFIRSSDYRDACAERAQSGLVLSARSALSCPTANQNAPLRQVVAHQESAREQWQRERARERVTVQLRVRCAFSRFLKWIFSWHFSGTQRFFLVPFSRLLSHSSLTPLALCCMHSTCYPC